MGFWQRHRLFSLGRKDHSWFIILNPLFLEGGREAKERERERERRIKNVALPLCCGVMGYVRKIGASCYKDKEPWPLTLILSVDLRSIGFSKVDQWDIDFFFARTKPLMQPLDPNLNRRCVDKIKVIFCGVQNGVTLFEIQEIAAL